MKKKASRAPKLTASAALIDDLVAGSRILAKEGVLDGYGHISARSDKRPANFIMSLPGDERKGFIERYIHGEIYRTRPDVMAVVHSHSPSVIPFGVTKTKLRPVYHMGSFLWSGAPVWDIRQVRRENDVLVRDRPLGQALATALGSCNCVLMRGHGMTIVGDGVQEAVFRAIYTEMNARLQIQAQQLEGPIEFLSEEEGKRSTVANRGTVERPWELWKKHALEGD
jgi:ribulose-5-phosphate 4-epimerase/fuculose-1-phosphate aldolase